MDSQVIAIIKFLIKETPIGHLKSTLDSLKTIIGLDILESSDVKKEIIAYEEEHLKQVSIEEDKVLLSHKNKDDENNYYDQNKELKFTNTPLSENLDNIEKSPSEEDKLRSLIYKNLKEYKQNNYKSEVSAINGKFIYIYIIKLYNKVFRNSNENEYHILISAHNYNFKNFWSGEWLSLWKLTNNNNDYEVSGDVRIATYYNEDGNVQFKFNKSYSSKIENFKNDEELAKEVIDCINTFENNVQYDLETIYDDLSENYLKPLRRRMPITGQKMNWDLHQINFKNK